jgi:hypothetical protein
MAVLRDLEALSLRERKILGGNGNSAELRDRLGSMVGCREIQYSSIPRRISYI